MSYRHQFVEPFCDQAGDLPLGKVVCVGRNYAEHAKELNNAIPATPMLFIKPATSVVGLETPISIPQDKGRCHHELEVSVLIGKTLVNATAEESKQAVIGYGLGLDLTLRDVQDRLKANGHPWEAAKAFDGACPLSQFIPAAEISNPLTLNLTLERNGQLQQQGNTAEMITGIFELIAYMSTMFTLLPGDVVMTGTPAGVGPLLAGDQLVLTLFDSALKESGGFEGYRFNVLVGNS
ncbi:MAG: isomerase/hydrolase [Moraxellaceae bacterium]|nr:MAG: isomerase/hydrolase [Moraxellaceae bacterium]